MDILIKNMEMPKSCEKCPLKCVVKSNPMIITNKGVSRLTKEKDCPLVPVPEHGDLIDKDFLKQHLEACETNGRPLHRMELQERLECIDDVPVVLERTT